MQEEEKEEKRRKEEGKETTREKKSKQCNAMMYLNWVTHFCDRKTMKKREPIQWLPYPEHGSRRLS